MADRQTQWALTYYHLLQSTANQNGKLIHCHCWDSYLYFRMLAHFSDHSAKSYPSVTVLCVMFYSCHAGTIWCERGPEKPASGWTLGQHNQQKHRQSGQALPGLSTLLRLCVQVHVAFLLFLWHLNSVSNFVINELTCTWHQIMDNPPDPPPYSPFLQFVTFPPKYKHIILILERVKFRCSLACMHVRKRNTEKEVYAESLSQPHS
jgi:hypothetical protein